MPPLHGLFMVLLVATVATEDFQVAVDRSGAEQTTFSRQKWVNEAKSQHKPKTRAGVLVARFVPQSQLPHGLVVPFVNITYRIVGEDMTMPNIRAKFDDFEVCFKKLYGAANLHARLIYVRPAEPSNGTIGRPCRESLAACCQHKGHVADPETWSAIDVTLEIGCSRNSLWPDQGSVDWAHSRVLGTLFLQHGFHEVRCLLQRADVLPNGVHAHKYLPITALYTEETTLQFVGNSLSQWLPVDTAMQNLILYSMDLVGLNRIAGCARIRISHVSQRCLWEPGRGQIGIANITFVTHREYPSTTLPMAFEKTMHVLLERLNEEGLNLGAIAVVANRPVVGPEWGNMHDQIKAMLTEEDPVRTYETRVPLHQLPNYRSSKKLFHWTLAYAIMTTVLAAAVGGIALCKKRLSAPAVSDNGPGTTHVKEKTEVMNNLSCENKPKPVSFQRHESTPFSQGTSKMWERSPVNSPQMSMLGSGKLTGWASSPSPSDLMQAHVVQASSNLNQQNPENFNASLERIRSSKEVTSVLGEDADLTFDNDERDDGGMAFVQQYPWQASMESPNPFANAHLSKVTVNDSESRLQNYGTVPAATVIQQGSLHDTDSQKQEQYMRTQKLKERGARFVEQLARADSVALASWLLSDGEIEICLKEDGQRWLLGTGAYGKVYRGVRGGVQDVAVKVLNNTDEFQVNQFCLEIKLLKSLSFDRNIVQFLGVCLHSGNPMLVLEFMEGGDLRQALSAPHLQHLYQWENLGQHVALDIVRGLHFLHRKRVVHSDLKSRNVLLGRDGRTAKLSDVGMSRILSGSCSTVVPGQMSGTFPYAAPELLLGQSCTVKADIFSLGVLIWEICTHEVPVRGMLRKLHLGTECSGSLATLIEECMRFDPSRRPSAREVFDRIRPSATSQAAKVQSLEGSGDLASKLSV